MKPANPKKKMPIIVSVVYPKEIKKFNPPLRMFKRNIWRD